MPPKPAGIQFTYPEGWLVLYLLGLPIGTEIDSITSL